MSKGEHRSPYLEAGVKRKSLFSNKRKKPINDLAGVSTAYKNRKKNKNYKPQGISLKASDLW